MTYEAGVSRREITPSQEWIDEDRIWLWGYGSRTAPCSGVLDPLDVRALAIRADGDGTTILISADLGALHPASTDRIRQRVTATHGIAGEFVCVNISHTHSAPVFASIPTWQLGVATADGEYVQFVEDEVVSAVADAVADLRPALIAFGRASTAIAWDRHPGTGAALDRTLDVVQVTGLGGTPIAVVFVAACHPVARGSDNLVSADFVGPARNGVESAAGGLAIFLQGYAGTCTPAGVNSTAEAIGAALAADVLTVLNGPMDTLDGPLDAWLTTAELPLQPIPAGAVAAASGDPDLFGRWASWIQQQGDGVPAVLPTPLQAIRIGTGRHAWYLAASSHEVVMDLAGRVRGLWPYERVTVAAYSNSQLSYIPSRAVLEKPVACSNFPFCNNNYEGGRAFVWYGHRGPLTTGAELDFIEAHIRLLDHGWDQIGHATDLVGLTSWEDRLFAVTSNNVLCWRTSIAEEAPWHPMGHATDVCGLTACDGMLFCATTDGKLWKRPIHGFDQPWSHIGHAISVVALTALDGRLFGATANNKLWRRDPVDFDIAWDDMGHAQFIAGLAATRGKLFAATTDGNLHWREPFGSDRPWHRYGHAQQVVAMTAISDHLYAATQEGKLWQRPV